MYILGVLQRIGGILERTIFMVIPVPKSLSIPGLEKQKRRAVRMTRMDVGICLRAVDNTWTCVQIRMLGEAGDSNVPSVQSCPVSLVLCGPHKIHARSFFLSCTDEGSEAQ